MSETLDYLKMFIQFPLVLRRFLRQTMTLDEAKRNACRWFWRR